MSVPSVGNPVLASDVVWVGSYARGMSEQEPLFRVVRGIPTAEELAALVGVVIARSRPAAPTWPPAGSAWLHAARPGALSPSGAPVRPGANAWRRSGLPR